MIAGEQGFLLLTSHLGDPERKILTLAQFRELTRRARLMEKPDAQREMTQEDLVAIGCSVTFAQRVLMLLSQEDQLQWYLENARRHGCVPVTRLHPAYPGRVRKMLALEAPGVLWAKGNLSLLEKPKLSLVGSRVLHPQNRQFAWEVGTQAAKHGVCLVSGNARGADSVAQVGCLAAGGRVISVVADTLAEIPEREGVLYLSEEGYDLAFSAQRALSRNRVIHTMSAMTFVAQCTLGKGGTWDGTTRNLAHGWSDVFCFRDGSAACRELSQRGAVPVCLEELSTILTLQSNQPSFFDQ